MLDFLFTLVTVLAAAAFAQFGVTLDTKPANHAAANPEVHRTVEGGDQARNQAPGQTPAMNGAPPVVHLPTAPLPTVGRKGGG